MNRLLLCFTIFICQLTTSATESLQKMLPIRADYGIDNTQLLRRSDCKSTDELPMEIKQKLSKYLAKKLGEENYHQLDFSGLWYIDRKKLIEKSYRRRLAEEEIYKYHIEYKIKLEEFGISELKTYIRLKEDLSVQRDIGLPPQAAWNFLKIETIWPKALKRLKKGDDYEIDFEYDEARDRMNWVVRSVMRVAHSGSGEAVAYDAVTGEFINITSFAFDGF